MNEVMRAAGGFGTLLYLSLTVLSLAPTPAAAGADEPEIARETLYFDSRGDIPLEHRWDITAILPDRDAWEAARKDVEAALPGLDEYRGRLGESAETLAAALGTAFDIARAFEDVYVYAGQSLHTQIGDADAQGLFATAQALGGRLQEASAFIDPELARIPPDTLARFLEHAALKPYLHYIDNVVRTREHILSPEIEQVLAGASLPGAAHAAAAQSLEGSDIEWPTIQVDGEDVKVVPGQYTRLVTEANREVRRDASLALFGAYTRFANTFAGTLRGSIQRDVWLARTRGYETTLDMALDSTNVPRSVVDTLVGTVHDNIDAIQGYGKLRQKMLGLDELHIYDMYVNLLPEVDRTYTYDEGWALAMEFWKETFGPEYAAVAERARRERWVDVYTNEGKRPGAYSWGTYDSHPYLFLNWNGKLDGVSTLVHEMGHSIHSHLAAENQTYHEYDYSLFVAEVASVASESLFLEWMLARSKDPAERKLLLNRAMDNITGTFVRQVFFHEWEAGAHAMAERGEPLTRESMGQAYGDLWKTYYGPTLTVDDEYQAGWARVSHFYRTFYVWVYATSYAAGEAIAKRFREGDETAVKDYLAMLKLGGSVYPMQALERAGVDMSDPQVIRAVMDRYGELQRRLETELAP
jgi:oligoendopeptidase F